MNYNEILKSSEKSLFEDALVIFDTSALLDLYYFNENIAVQILEVCNIYFKGRLFITDHIKYEYIKNRDIVIKKPYALYDEMLVPNKNAGYMGNVLDKLFTLDSNISKTIKDVKGLKKTFKEHYGKSDKHPFLDEELIENIDSSIEDYLDELESLHKENNKIKDIEKLLKDTISEKKVEIKARIGNDRIKEIIFKNFQVSREYKYSELLGIVREGEIRYSNLIPPGYKDYDDKKGFQKYADLIIWKQILELCREKGLGCIFVSNDIKEDWNEDDMTPRHELLLEFKENTDNIFLKYKLRDFLYTLNSYLENGFTSETMKGIEQYYLKNYFIDKSELIANDFIFNIEDELMDFFYDEEYAEFYIDDFESDINNIEFVDIEDGICTLILSVYVNVSASYNDYWGRDDETGELIVSPTNYANYDGVLNYNLEIEFLYDAGEVCIGNTYYSFIDSDIESEYKSWDEYEDI